MFERLLNAIVIFGKAVSYTHLDVYKRQVNMYVNNTTKIKEDPQLAAWFREKYAYLEADPKIEVLWNNTDFGVGEVLS